MSALRKKIIALTASWRHMGAFITWDLFLGISFQSRVTIVVVHYNTIHNQCLVGNKGKQVAHI